MCWQMFEFVAEEVITEPGGVIGHGFILKVATEDSREPACADRGGWPEFERERLWRCYQHAAAYACIAATVTAGLGGMQFPAIALAGLQQAVAALDDLDTVAALRKVL